MKIKIAKLKLPVKNKRFLPRDAEKLRGYFGNVFQEYIEFHHHIDEFTFQYYYSKIQYKVIDGCFFVLGIQEAGDLLTKVVSEIDKIVIQDEIFDTIPEIQITFPTLTVSQKIYKYQFETPWFALNQKNYAKYKRGEFDFNKQLQNNILEFFKMCRVQANERIEVKGNFRSFLYRQKDTNIIAFVGEFETNVDMPDDISLGKRKSIGLGRIKKNKIKK